MAFEVAVDDTRRCPFTQNQCKRACVLATSDPDPRMWRCKINLLVDNLPFPVQKAIDVTARDIMDGVSGPVDKDGHTILQDTSMDAKYLEPVKKGPFGRPVVAKKE